MSLNDFKPLINETSLEFFFNSIDFSKNGNSEADHQLVNVYGLRNVLDKCAPGTSVIFVSTVKAMFMTPCLFSVSYAGFWGQASLNLHDFIRHAGGLGFPSVMIAGKRPHLSPLDMTPENVTDTRLISCAATLEPSQDVGIEP